MSGTRLATVAAVVVFAAAGFLAGTAATGDSGRIADLESELVRAEADVDDAHATAEALQGDLDALQGDYDTLVSDHEALQDEVEDLRVQVDELTTTRGRGTGISAAELEARLGEWDPCLLVTSGCDR